MAEGAIDGVDVIACDRVSYIGLLDWGSPQIGMKRDIVD